MLSVLLPSRGRPESCRKAIASARSTAEGEIEILLYVDSDDPERNNYPDPIIGPPLHSGAAMKHLASLATGNLLMFGSDDITWKTPGWDRIFREKMPAHELAVLYYMDMRGAAKSQNPVFSRKWMEFTGLFPDLFQHFGPDTWIIDTARRAKQLIRVDEVWIEHRKIKDATHARARQNGDANHAKSLLDARVGERQAMATRIGEAVRAFTADFGTAGERPAGGG
jgi:hypothetical protein